MNKLRNMLCWKLVAVIGKPVFVIDLFKLPLFAVTATLPGHWNVYLLCIPLLRITHTKTDFGISILLFTWLFKGLWRMVTCWKVIRTATETRVLFKGKTVYSSQIVSPFGFTAAKFIN